MRCQKNDEAPTHVAEEPGQRTDRPYSAAPAHERKPGLARSEATVHTVAKREYKGNKIIFQTNLFYGRYERILCDPYGRKDGETKQNPGSPYPNWGMLGRPSSPVERPTTTSGGEFKGE
jgi:hypothetical protein